MKTSVKKSRRKIIIGMFFLLLAFPGTFMAAGQKNVYVLTSVTDPGKRTTKLSYNKNGLLSKAVIPSSSFGAPDQEMKISYSKDGLMKKLTRIDWNITHIDTFSYKAGKVSAHTSVVKREKGSKETLKASYKWKGRTFTYTVRDTATGEKKATVTGKLDSKNRLLSVSEKYAGDPAPENLKFKYDGKGFLKTIKHDSYMFSLKNTVKNGRLVKMVQDKYSTYTFKYKKIQIPASFAGKVKAQQSYIVNNLLLNWYTFNYPVW